MIFFLVKNVEKVRNQQGSYDVPSSAYQGMTWPWGRREGWPWLCVGSSAWPPPRAGAGRPAPRLPWGWRGPPPAGPGAAPPGADLPSPAIRDIQRLPTTRCSTTRGWPSVTCNQRYTEITHDQVQHHPRLTFRHLQSEIYKDYPRPGAAPPAAALPSPAIHVKGLSLEIDNKGQNKKERNNEFFRETTRSNCK